jgi:hypothetical protein
MARPTKLTKALQTKIVSALKTGATIEDVCQYCGIGSTTFYEWQAIGVACIEGGAHARMPEDPAEQARFAEFADSIGKAQVDAKMAAIKALKTAMLGYSQTSTTVETFTETRFKDGKPYEYVRKTERKQVTRYAGDWKAGIEYLKRRHFDEWGDKAKIDDWQSQAIADIKAGRIEFEALADGFGTEEAARLFAAAGKPAQAGAGAAQE